VLNTIASKGYAPIIRRGDNKPKGIWSKNKRQNKDEEEGVNKNKNTPKNHSKAAYR
jgi:hypothetical protein